VGGKAELKNYYIILNDFVGSGAIHPRAALRDSTEHFIQEFSPDGDVYDLGM
jgi:hypothetical protein